MTIEQISTASKVFYLHHDQEGATRLLTGSNGKGEGKCSYSAYGAPTCEGTATSLLGYDGEYTNGDTGLIYMRARNYDPASGQFLTVDPLEAITGSPYNYAGDNPLNESDPTGLGVAEAIVAGCEDDPVACALLGAAAGTVGVIAGRRASEEALNAMTSGEPTYESDEGEAGLEKKEAGRERESSCPQTPTGQRGSPMDVPNGTNAPDEINGIPYTGHALDEMQSEGFPPSLVEDVIANGEKTLGDSGRIGYYSPDNNVTVVVEDGQVITVSSGSLNIR